MVNEEETVFRVEYKCKNCGNAFSEEYCKGDEVEEHWDGIYLHSDKCTHNISCKFCRTICCLICESERIKIINREAI